MPGAAEDWRLVNVEPRAVAEAEEEAVIERLTRGGRALGRVAGVLDDLGGGA